METAPTADAVYQGVYALYNNPDNNEKEKASKWLDSLQKSVCSVLVGLARERICEFHSTIPPPGFG